MADTYIRTAPFNVEAMQATSDNLVDMQNWINDQQVVDNHWSYDADGLLTVRTGVDQYGEWIMTSIRENDLVYFYPVFSRYFSVDNPTDFFAALDLHS